MMKRILEVPLILAVTMLLLAPAPGRAQAPAAANDRAAGRWELIVYSGGISGNPWGKVEALLTEGGFDDDWSGFFFTGSTSHPYTRPSGESSFTLAYAYRPGWQVRFSHSIVASAEISGYDDATYLLLDLRTRVNCESLVLSRQFAPALRLGAGPAYYSCTISRNPGGKQTGLRLLAEGAITYPTRGWFVAELVVQYRHLGSVSLGPFKASSSTRSLSTPGGETRLNHLAFLLGFGVRF